MTYEEAIRLLHPNTSKEAIAELEYYNGFNKDKTISTINEAIILLCGAAEKQIPKKATVEPLYAKGNPNPIDYYVMCECGKWICYPNEYEAKDNYKYCPKCGNRIEWDWSDEEDD